MQRPVAYDDDMDTDALAAAAEGGGDAIEVGGA